MEIEKNLSSLEIIKKNILDIDEGIIAQQVNCQGVMGAGLALDIKKKYPKVFDEYRALTSRTRELLGKCQLIEIKEGKFYVANLFGQFFYGKGLQTDYKFLERSLIELSEQSKRLSLPVYLPYKIGCGLAGGDWRIVEKIIQATIPTSKICKL